MRRGALVGFGAVLLVVGTALVVLGAWQVVDQQSQVPTPTLEATVTDKQQVRGAGQGGATGYGVRYRFALGGREYSTGDGRGKTGVLAAITQQQYDGLTVGGPITIVYDRRSPANNRPAPLPRGIADGVALSAAGLLALGCGALTLLVARRAPAGARAH
jgi:hypothetical protein